MSVMLLRSRRNEEHGAVGERARGLIIDVDIARAEVEGSPEYDPDDPAQGGSRGRLYRAGSRTTS